MKIVIAISLIFLMLLSCDNWSIAEIANRTPYVVELHIRRNYGWPTFTIYSESGEQRSVPEDGKYHTGYLNPGVSYGFMEMFMGRGDLSISEFQNIIKSGEEGRDFDFFIVIQDSKETRIDMIDLFKSEYIQVEKVPRANSYRDFIIFIIEP